MKRIKVEYEVPPLRAVYFKDFHDYGFDDKELIEFLENDRPLWRVRQITRYETEEEDSEQT